MNTTVLRRYRKCAFCDLAAVDDSSLCRPCLDEVERDNEVPNFEACPVCSGELRRGHCYGACTLDAWSPAQVMAR